MIEYGDRSATLIEIISEMSNQAVDAVGENWFSILETCRYQIAGKR